MTLVQTLTNNKVNNTFIVTKPNVKETATDKQIKDITLIKLLSSK